MGKKKRYRGQFCKICHDVKSNESFSGKGHRNNICKACAKLPKERRDEILELSQLWNTPFGEYGITKKGKRLLENRIKNSRFESVKKRATKMLEENEKFLLERSSYEEDIDYNTFVDESTDDYNHYNTFVDDEDIPF